MKNLHGTIASKVRYYFLQATASREALISAVFQSVSRFGATLEEVTSVVDDYTEAMQILHEINN